MNIIEKISLLKWGLPKQEYKNIFSNKQWFPNHPTQNAVGFSDEIENRNVSVVAYFIINDEIDRLARIVINFENIETDTQRKFIFENQVKDLNKLYGEMKYSTTMTRLDTSQEYRLSELIIWKKNNTTVNATLALSEHGCLNPGVTIAFGDGQNDPVSKQWDWIDDIQKNSDN